MRTRKPNLLLFHVLTTDAINHANGPGSQASFAAFAYADRLVGDLLKSIEDAGLKDKATVLVATDHGFKKISKVIYPNVVLRKAGLVQVDKEQVSACDAYVMAQGGMAFVYVMDRSRREALLPQLKEIFAATEGVDRVIDGTEGPSLGMPTPSENEGMGDLILYPKAGYAFQGKYEGEEPVAVSTNYLGTHGYINTDPQLDGAFIAWGYGIKPGARVPRISNLDVAPTLAELLGVKLPDVEGKVLRDMMK
jgi:predicted AlkP superfamily pyrophosphatase or phosphodiesterase